MGNALKNKDKCMKVWIIIFSHLLVFSFSTPLHAQELKAKVVVNTAQLSNTKTEVFDALREKVEAFLNEHQWTGLQFRETERIECNFNITVNSWDESESMIKSTMMMTASRPVFNSAYNTTLYSVRDGDFQFRFLTLEPLVIPKHYFRPSFHSFSFLRFSFSISL